MTEHIQEILNDLSDDIESGAEPYTAANRIVDEAVERFRNTLQVAANEIAASYVRED